MVVFPITIDGRPAVAEIKAVEVESDKLHQALSGLVASVDRLEKQLASQARVTKEVTQATKEETKATEANAQATEKVEQAAKEAAAAKQAQRQALQGQREEARRAAEQNQRYAHSMQAVQRASVQARGALIGMVALGGASLGAHSALRLLGDLSERVSILGAVSRANAGEMALLNQQAQRLGESTRFTASQAVDAQIALARSGMRVNEVLEATSAVLGLATIGQLQLGEAATFTANGIRQFGLAASEASRVTDALVIVSNRANTDVRQMAEALSYAGPVARSVGLSIEETAAAIGVLGDAGITGSMAGTNIRGMLSDLLSSSDVTQRALQRMGLTMEDVNPITQGLDGVFRNLRSSGFGASEAIEIFGDRNAAAALVMSESLSKLRALTEQQDRFRGETEQSARMIEQNLRGSFLELASAAEGVITKLGDGGLVGILRDIVDTGSDAIRVLGGLSQQERDVGTAGQVAAIALAGFAGHLGGKALEKGAGLVRNVGTAIRGIATGATGIGGVTRLLGPLGLGIGVVTEAYAAWNDQIERNAHLLAKETAKRDLHRSSTEQIYKAQESLRGAEQNRFGLEGARIISQAISALTPGISFAFDGAGLDGQRSVVAAIRTVQKENAALLRDMQARIQGPDASDYFRRVNREPGIVADPLIAAAQAAPGGWEAAYRRFIERRDAELVRRGVGPGMGLSLPQETRDTVFGEVTAQAAVETLREIQRSLEARVFEGREAIAEGVKRQSADVADRQRTLDAASIGREIGERIAREQEQNRALSGVLANPNDPAARAELIRLATRQEFSDQIERGGAEVGALVESLAQARIEGAGIREAISAAGKSAESSARAVRGESERTSRAVQQQHDIGRRLGELWAWMLEQARAPVEAVIAAEQYRGVPKSIATRHQRIEELRGNPGLSANPASETKLLLDELARLEDVQRVATGIGEAIAGGLERAVFSAGSLREILKATALDLYRVLFQQLVAQPIASGVGAAGTNLFASIFQGGVTRSASGNVLSFGAGGLPELITRPTTFPMRGGRTGLAGESGPEVAIAPLRRTSRGELGVSIADGARGDTISQHFQMHFHNVPDQQTAQVAAARVRTVMRRALRDRRGDS